MNDCPGVVSGVFVLIDAVLHRTEVSRQSAAVGLALHFALQKISELFTVGLR